MKKIIIIFAIILIVGIIAYFVIFGRSVSPVTENRTESLPAISPGNASTTIRASQVLNNLPTGPMFAIGTAQGSVGVKNFYLSNPEVTEGGTVILKQTQNYSIVYNSLTSSFWLAIVGTPFVTWQPVVEQDLLNVLQVSKDDACKLNVSSGIYYDPNNPLSGKSFPLSFCNQAFGK